MLLLRRHRMSRVSSLMTFESIIILKDSTATTAYGEEEDVVMFLIEVRKKKSE
jgi:hypothetical protein